MPLLGEDWHGALRAGGTLLHHWCGGRHDARGTCPHAQGGCEGVSVFERLSILSDDD